MKKKQRVIVVMPAYNAESTLEKTYKEVMDTGCVDFVVVVDDASRDRTVEIAKKLPFTHVIVHDINRGYGGNQKTCYQTALELGGDIIVMVHPDYQYTPRLIPAMVSMISSGLYECVIASRLLGGGALKGGMPIWRYLPNRFLTFVQNLLMGAKLSEYHTGYRAFSRKLLDSLPLKKNSDDFVFDNQMLAQIVWCGHTIAEITCPTKYFREASSINFSRSIVYGLGCLGVALRFRLAKLGFLPPMVEHRCQS
jgi:glycosyltransferase involved in cell wall biosynthesis